MEETVAKINPGLLDTGHLDKALSQHFYITFYFGLLHPKTIVEGCLYLNVNGLLWSESVMGYYGRMVYGSYNQVAK